MAGRRFLWIIPPLPNSLLSGRRRRVQLARQRRSGAAGPAERVGPVFSWIVKVDPFISIVGPPSPLSPGSRMDARGCMRIIAGSIAGDHDVAGRRQRCEQGNARRSP